MRFRFNLILFCQIVNCLVYSWRALTCSPKQRFIFDVRMFVVWIIWRLLNWSIWIWSVLRLVYLVWKVCHFTWITASSYDTWFVTSILLYLVRLKGAYQACDVVLLVSKLILLKFLPTLQASLILIIIDGGVIVLNMVHKGVYFVSKQRLFLLTYLSQWSLLLIRI